MVKLLVLSLFVSSTLLVIGQKKGKNSEPKPVLFEEKDLSQLAFRSIGPALTSGRVSDIAVHPDSKDIWYVAAASGGLWYTENHGITFKPIFDNYASYSIACVEIAPSNTNVVWVGTGENNNQRSVSYGDGVYKSLDGGKTFKNMGLKKSEHIGNILIHPKNENILWVAAYGPLWSEGGDRGVYKSTDGGQTWNNTLFVSEHTGISELAMDPENPDILYATAHQRRRREWTYIGGGPESGIYKSTDGGTTWKEINNGLPKEKMGRIGIAVSPSNANIVYAIVEARYGKGGFYKSTNKGESWSKQSDYNTSGNYYQEIFVDPKNEDKIFAMDTYMHHSTDGGKTFKATGEAGKHVDNHVIWIDPSNTNHWLVGCDGGVYETYSHAAEWHFFVNLPITQFYKVATDNAEPFYHVYGGTQDNNSMGGPSSSNNVAGILNTDWYITNGGDGFESAVDWSNPNIVYAQAQYGWLVRYDKASGEKVPIQPMPGENEEGYRWNWDAPIVVSKHDPKTVYFAANKVFKSINRGDDWKTISPDLSQGIDRNQWKVMDQIWSIDAVMKNASTTIYGNIVAMDESPLKKGLLYVGTDDGLIQVSENDGETWTKYANFPGIPKNTRVNAISADLYDENTVYAVFNGQRSGDFAPLLLRSKDRGATWEHLESNLPIRGNTYCLKQDHKDANLLFCGTENGAYFSNDQGGSWTKIAGLPTIAVYDLDIQKREDDLVAATFGRGFYVLDNYAPLRNLNAKNLSKEVHLFPIKDALLYIPKDPLGLKGTGFQGHSLYKAPNVRYGSVFSVYVKNDFKSQKEIRQEKEQTLEKDKKDFPYPTFDALKKENSELEPCLLFVITDEQNMEVKRIHVETKRGLNQVNWNLRQNKTDVIGSKGEGLLVVPNTYYLSIISLSGEKNEIIDTLYTRVPFKVKGLNNQTMLASDMNELMQFRTELSEFNRSFDYFSSNFRKTQKKSNQIKEALLTEGNGLIHLVSEVQEVIDSLDALSVLLDGDRLKSKYEFETRPSLSSRFGMLQYKVYANTTGVSTTHRKDFEICKNQFTSLKNKTLVLEKRIKNIIDQMEEAGMPYMPE